MANEQGIRKELLRHSGAALLTTISATNGETGQFLVRFCVSYVSYNILTVCFNEV